MDIIHRLVFLLKTQRFGDWIVSIYLLSLRAGDR
jgi:hypothetical protein